LRGRRVAPTGGGSLLDKAKQFAELGFHIVPKGTPQNPKANPPGRYDEIWPVAIEDFPWHRYNGIGAYAGPRDGIVAIDIDHVALATASGLFEVLKPKKHFETRRTKGRAYDVQKGLSRGSVLFKYDGDRLKRTGPLFARTNGFEVLYGKDIVQLHGIHPSGDAYSVRGTLQPLPDALLDFLVQKTDECQPNIHEDPSRPEDKDVPAIDHDRAANLLSKFEQAANNGEYVSKGGHLRLQEYNGRLQLAGRCIVDHDGGNHENEMHVFVTDKGFSCHCFHQRCRADLRRWVDTICRAFVFDTIHQPVTFDASLLKDCHDDIIHAQATHFGSNVVIEAPTGSGKTRGSVLVACAALSGEYPWFADDNKLLIAVSSKSEIQNVIREFQDVLGTQPVSAHGIYAVEGKNDVNVGADRSLTEAPENARVVVSHHTYLSRKGLSIYSYALMAFIDTKTYVIIDEADAWVDAHIISIPLGSRSKTQTFRISQETRHVHVEHCPVMTLSGNCLSCWMNRYDMRLYTYNSDINVMEYKPRSARYENDTHEVNPHIELPHDRLITTLTDPEANVEVAIYRDSESVRDIVLYERTSSERKDLVKVVYDVFDNAYSLAVHRYYISDTEGHEVSTDFVRENWIDQEKHVLDKDQGRFPYYACNVKHAVCLDRMSINHVAKAAAVMLMTATIVPSKLRGCLRTNVLILLNKKIKISMV
jgi:hypothetical protein